MKPVTQINFLSIKPEKMAEFFDADRRYFASVPRPEGLASSRLYRSLDGTSAVRVSTFESIEAHRAIHESESLRQQIATLRPFVESSSSALYEDVSATADVR
jgi:quinol monooxygenase YgiN